MRFVWIEIDELLACQKAWKRTGKTRRSASSKCCKHWSADHSPAAGGRVSRSIGSVLTSRCQRSGVVERTAWTSASQVVNEHLLLSILCPKRTEIAICPTHAFWQVSSSHLNHTPQNGFPATVYPMFALRFTRLLWRPVIFRPSHLLCISNQAEAAKRSGTGKQRTYQSGITEEHVRRPRDVRACTVRCGQSEGTNILLLLGNYINNLSRTYGLRLRCDQFSTSSTSPHLPSHALQKVLSEMDLGGANLIAS